MGIDSAATFLVCVILLGSGVIVCAGIVLLINNLLHRYWKDLHWNLPEALRGMPYHREQQHDLDRSQEPPLDRK